jgi:translation elongation factor EF-Tu-like GTPase
MKLPQIYVVTGVEMFRKLLDYAEAGDNIGAFFVVLPVMTLNVDKFLQSQVLLLHTQTSKHKFMYFLKKKVDVTLHSSQTTAHSSTSVLLT